MFANAPASLFACDGRRGTFSGVGPCIRAACRTFCDLIRLLTRPRRCVPSHSSLVPGLSSRQFSAVTSGNWLVAIGGRRKAQQYQREICEVREKWRPCGRAQGGPSAGKPPTPDAIWSPHRLSGFRKRAPLRRSGNRPVRTVGWKGDLWYVSVVS